MRVSLALGTYNGERFLPDQLASIREQTRLPDELIVCDDGSTDGTVGLVRSFCDRMPFRTRIEVNAANRGSTPNFARAIELCSGDIIALADQDDVWLPNKLATLEAAFLRDPKMGFAFSDARVVDESLKPLGYTLWRALQFSRTEQEQFREGAAFELLLRRYRVTGATMAFRTSHRDLILPIPSGWVHDAWIALLISSAAPCAVLAEPLVQYRKHAGQQHGDHKRGLLGEFQAAQGKSRDDFEAVAARYTEAMERLTAASGVRSDRLAMLAGKVEHCSRRAAMRAGGWRLPAILGELRRGNYSRFSRGWKSAAQDLFLS
jgi:hypothetical protein